MYAQKNYSQPLGNSRLSIAEAGCLLTAICNGLEKLDGTAPDPPTLDLWFASRGLFGYDRIDQANDDLAWNSITKYDPTIVNTATGTSAVPPSNNAIVRFDYNSVHTGQPISHYCWVDHVDGSGVWIIDSWDGVLKAPGQYESVYHLPKAWGIFVKNVPAPAPPPPAPTPVPVVTKPPAAPLPISYAGAGTPYTTVVPLKGYQTATQAGNQTPNVKYDIVPEGEYFVYRYYPGNNNLVNITLTKGQQGWWVNNSLNKVPEPTPPPAPKLSTDWPVYGPTEKVSTPSWEDSYKAFPNPKEYIINWPDTPLLDGTTGNKKTLTLSDGTSAQDHGIMIAGTVTYSDNHIYYRRNLGLPEQWGLIPITDEYGRAYLTEMDSFLSLAEKTALNKPTMEVRITKAINSIEKVMDILRPKGKK